MLSYGNVHRGDTYIPTTTPEYSTLYHLEPIGLGTADVEGLDSYLSRLAWRHNVKPSSLVRFVAGSIDDISINSRIVDYQMVNWCGIEDRLQDYISALNQMTMRDDLSNLTMRNWYGHFDSKGLTKKNEEWCPHCLEDWLQNGIVYRPLKWRISGNKFCSRHQCELVSKCPHCQKHMKNLLSGTGVVGFCSRCGHWLGEKYDPCDSAHRQSNEEMHREIVVADLVQQGQSTNSHIIRSRLAQIVQLFIAHAFNGVKGRAGKHLHLEYGHLNRIIDSTQVIQLEPIIKILAELDVTVTEALEGTDDALVERFKRIKIATIANKCQERLDRKKKIVAEKNKIEKLLKEIPKRDGKRLNAVWLSEASKCALGIKIDPAPTIGELATILDIGLGTVQKYFQQEYKFLKAKPKQEEIPVTSLNSVPDHFALSPIEQRLLPISKLKGGKHNPHWISAALEIIQAEYMSTPQPLSSVAKLLGVGYGVIKYHCPDEAQKIIEDHREYKQKLVNEQRDREIQAVYEAVTVLHRNGETANNKKVMAATGLDMRRKHVAGAYRDAVKGLVW